MQQYKHLWVSAHLRKTYGSNVCCVTHLVRFYVCLICMIFMTWKPHAFVTCVKSCIPGGNVFHFRKS